MAAFRKTWVRVALILVPCLYWILFAEVFPRMLVQPPRIPSSTKWADSLGYSYKVIEVPVSPDIRLKGWWFSADRILYPVPRGIVLGLHGHAASKEQLLGLVSLLCPEGYDVVLYDSRAHGQSGGKAGTFGFEEKKDLGRMLDFIVSQSPGHPLAAYGFSYGGGVVLQALPDEPRLSCAVVEGAFSSLQAVIRSRVHSIFRFEWPRMADWIVERAGQKAEFPASTISPGKSALRITRPVFLAHGTQDSYNPFEQGEEIWKALPDKSKSEWHPVEGADHDILFSRADDAYHVALLEFLAKNCR